MKLCIHQRQAILVPTIASPGQHLSCISRLRLLIVGYPMLPCKEWSEEEEESCQQNPLRETYAMGTPPVNIQHCALRSLVCDANDKERECKLQSLIYSRDATFAWTQARAHPTNEHTDDVARSFHLLLHKEASHTAPSSAAHNGM